MREILFKAKRKDNGEWVEGTPVFYKDGSMTLIDVNEYKSVGYHILNNGHLDRNTLCQYTGLTDKNGNKIWENDICTTDLERPYLIVEFRNGGFVYNCNDGGKDYYDIMEPLEQLVDSDKYTEVIGNIFDNPELLEGGAE